MKDQIKKLLKPIIAKRYTDLKDSPEKLDNASGRIYDVLEELRTNFRTLADERIEQNRAEYHADTCSGSVIFDIMFDRISDIMFDQYKSSPDATLTLNMKYVDDIDDSVIDANYELAEILDLVYSNSHELMYDALELNKIWRNYCSDQYKVEKDNPERKVQPKAAKYVETEEYLRRIDDCRKGLEICSNEPGAKISIVIEHATNVFADTYCVLYDHAAFVQSLDSALFELREELQ